MPVHVPLMSEDRFHIPKESVITKFTKINNIGQKIVLWNYKEYVFGKWDHKAIIASIRASMHSRRESWLNDLLIKNGRFDIGRIDSLSWGAQQKLSEMFATWLTGQDTLTPKEKNYFYVAEILNSTEMLREAAEFYCETVKKYENDPRLEGYVARESQHSWPCPPFSEDVRLILTTLPISSWFQSNISNRGYIQMVFTAMYQKQMIGKIDLKDGLRLCVVHMETLTKQQAYSDDDIGYIVRGMLQLRDITKIEKHKGSKSYVECVSNIVLKNRLVGAAVDYSRRALTKIGSANVLKFGLKFSNLYSIIDPDPGAQGLIYNYDHDHIQGISGSTLDYCNWLYYMCNGDMLKSARLFQVNYAGWHAIAPDGMAHSQLESINTIFDMWAGHHISDAIMVPFKSHDDVESMKVTIHNKLPYLVPTNAERNPGYTAKR